MHGHTSFGRRSTLVILAVFTFSVNASADPAPPHPVDTVATSCLRLAVRADGNLGHDGVGRANMDFWYTGECDTVDSIPGETSIYLRTGGPVIAYPRGDSIVVNHTWGATSNDSPSGFITVTDLVAPIFSRGITVNPNYVEYHSGQFVTRDSAIALERVIYVPTGAQYCDFMIVATRVFNYKPGPTSGLSVAELIDWNVPSDTGNLNEVAFNIMQPGVLYNRGVELNNDNTLECQDNYRRFGGMYHFISCTDIFPQRDARALWARPTESLLDSEAGLQKDSLWMSMKFTFDDIPGSPSQADWVSGINIWQNYNLKDNDTLRYVYAITSQRSGSFAQFQARMDMAKSWSYTYASPYYWCGSCPGCCCGLVGNADYDPSDEVDLTDLQVYIDYLFFGGQAGPCQEEFDTNNDLAVDISDLQLIIDFLFFGAELPECI